VDERGIEPHVNLIDKGERTDGTFSREPTSHSDASIIVADAHRRRGVAKVEDLDPTSSRAVAEYLSVLDDPAFSGATPVEPKVISPTDPAARYTASANSVAGYAYSDNYLIDLKHAVIVDVEATTTIRQAEVGAAKTMLDRHSPKSAETGKAYPAPGTNLRHTRRRPQIPPPDCRRNRYPLSSADGGSSRQSVDSGRSESKIFYAETFATTIRATYGLSRQTPSVRMTKSAGSKTCPLTKSSTARSMFCRSGSIKSKMNFDDPSLPSCIMPIVGS
jgi:hypothetical protein